MNDLWQEFIDRGRPFNYQGPSIWEMFFHWAGGWNAVAMIGCLALAVIFKPTRPYAVAGIVAFIFI